MERRGPVEGGERARRVAAEARSTLDRAIAKGGPAQRISEERLGPALSLVETITTQLDRALEAQSPALAAVSAASERARSLLDAVYNTIRDGIGRPAPDVALSLLFPGGTAYYAEGSAEERPDQMELLAQLLEAGMHPRLSPERAREAAADVRTAARGLREAVDASRIPRARVRLLERASDMVAQSAQNELSSLRRRLAAEGVSERDITWVLKGEERVVPEGGLKLA